MLSKPFVPITLLAATLFAFIAAFGETQAASILLGYCTQNKDACANDVEIKGDPSSDQGIPITDAKGKPFDCNSFKRTTEYKIKVCACGHSCNDCPDALCNFPTQNQCAESPGTGPFQAICSADWH